MHLQQQPTKPIQWLMLGMYPWNYSKLHDTVRCMAKAIDAVDLVYMNPQADTRSLSMKWDRKSVGTMELWNPPFSFLPTRYGVHRLREKLSAKTVPSYMKQQFGDEWRESAIFYVTASTLEQSYEYVKALEPKRLVFDVLDDNIGFPGISERKKNNLKWMFQEIAQRAELVTAVSQYLVDQTKLLTGMDVHYLPNGVDVDRFRWTEALDEPEDIAHIAHPRLTFVGAVTHWIDIPLLEKTACSLPDANIVIIGPVFEKSSSIENLKNMPNVHFIGERPFEDIPRYMHASDVLLLPRTYDPHSLACDPLKLYEYLATGKPIVSTAHPSTERFAHSIEIGYDDESFIDGIHRALTKKNESFDQLNPLVEGLSWKARAQKMFHLLDLTANTEYHLERVPKRQKDGAPVIIG